MESKSSDLAPAAPPPAETSNHRRRAGNPKRKAATAALSALSNLSAAFNTPSKRQSKDRNPSSLPHHMLFQSHHSGPLTRARQSPNKLGGSAASGSVAAGPSRMYEKELMIDLNGAALAGSGLDLIMVDEEVDDLLAVRREEEENAVNLEFEAVKSRGKDVHVVPTFAGEIIFSLKFQNLAVSVSFSLKFSTSNYVCSKFGYLYGGKFGCLYDT